jgi:hypothetical protein
MVLRFSPFEIVIGGVGGGTDGKGFCQAPSTSVTLMVAARPRPANNATAITQVVRV